MLMPSLRHTISRHAMQGNTALVQSLIADFNSSINGINIWGLTPLKMALINNCEETAELIRESGGRPVSRIHESYYPLHAAVLRGDLDKIKSIVGGGANIDQHDMSELTPMHLAVLSNNEEGCKLLIELVRPLFS